MDRTRIIRDKDGVRTETIQGPFVLTSFGERSYMVIKAGKVLRHGMFACAQEARVILKPQKGEIFALSIPVTVEGT